MPKNLRDNLAKFFYDAARVSLTVLVIGLVARGAFSLSDLVPGTVMTLTFVIFGITVDFVPTKGEVK